MNLGKTFLKLIKVAHKIGEFQYTSSVQQILSPAINKAPPIQKGASPIQKGASPAQKGEPPIQNYSTPWHMLTVADKENVLKKRKYVELKDCSEHKKFYNTWAVISSVQCLPRRHKGSPQYENTYKLRTCPKTGGRKGAYPPVRNKNIYMFL